MVASNVEINAEGVNIGEANTLDFQLPLVVEVDGGVANIYANTVKITELDSVNHAIGNDVIVIVTNVNSTPYTNRINISDVFGNISTPVVVYSNTSLYSNVLIANNSRLLVGNSTANVIVSPTIISVANSTAIANVLPGQIIVGNVVANTTSLTVGNVFINASTITIGNSTVNSTSNSSNLKLFSNTDFTLVTGNSVSVGNSTANVTVNKTDVTFSNSTVTFVFEAPTLEKFVSTGYFLSSTGEWTTVDVGIAAPAGNNLNIQFNDDNVMAGSDAFTFDNSSNTLHLMNGLFYVGNSSANLNINSSSIFVGANVSVNTTVIFVGNTTANTKLTQSLISISNSSGTANLTPINLTIGVSGVNATSVFVGSNVIANSSALIITSTDANLALISNSAVIGNSTVSVALTRETIKLGTASINVSINSTAIAFSNSTSNTKLKIPTAVQWGASNYFLHANGDWVTIPDIEEIPAGGGNTEVQFNDGGVITGNLAFTFNKTTNTVTIESKLIVGNGLINTYITPVRIQLANGVTNTGIRLPSPGEYSGPYFLHANGSWVNLYTYVSVAGSNTYVQINDSGSFGAVSSFAFNKTTNTLFIGNSTANVFVNTSVLKFANSTSNGMLKIPTAAEYGSSNHFLQANGTWSNILSVVAANTTPGGTNTNIQYNDEGTMNGTNAFTFDDSTNTVSILTRLMVGNSTVNAVTNSTSLKLSNSTSNINIHIPTVAERDGTYFLNGNGSFVIPTPAGSNTYVLFNDSGAYGAVSALTFSTASNTLTVSNNITSVGSIKVGNSTVNVTINSTSFAVANSTAATKLALPTAAEIADGAYFLNANGLWVDITAIVPTFEDANNANYLGTLPPAYYTNATNLDTGTVAIARLPFSNTAQRGIVQLVDAVDNTSIVIAPTANAVKRAFDNGGTAYSNAIAFAANATNLSSGTVAAARLPILDSVTNTSITWVAAANSAKTAYDNGTIKAAAAYSNAVAEIYIALRQRFGNNVCSDSSLGTQQSYIWPFDNSINGRGSGVVGGAAAIFYDHDTPSNGAWSFLNIDGNPIATFYANGNISCVSLTETSDLKLKFDVSNLIIGDEFLQVHAVRYKLLSDPDIEQIGFIAQDMQKVYPELVSMDGYGNLGINYSKATAILWEINRNQEMRLRALENAILNR